MAALTLPTGLDLQAITPRLVSARGELNSAFGGSAQRVARMGARTAIEVVVGPTYYEDAEEWSDLEAETETCIFEIPEPNIDMNGCGSPLVNGGSQAGSSLITDGWTPQFYIPKRKWISLTVSGVIYAYRTTSAVVASSLGAATLPIRPMLRAAPADNAVVSVNPAKIEGFVTFGDGAFRVDGDQILHNLSFTITERR